MRRRSLGAIFAAETLILLAWTAWRGQDVNWDWQNYHLYDAFAFLHGRFDTDVAPAGPQSFLNPLPYLIPYGLRHLPPLLAGLLQTATQLPPVFLATAIAWRLAGGAGAQRLAISAAAGLAACTGATVLSEAGTSFCDLALAALPLPALLLLLPHPGWRDGPALIRRLLAAGGLVGVAIGLKPTNLFLAPALACGAALLLPRVPRARDRMLGALALSAGLVAGALLADGFWAYRLVQAYRSPIFPFLNTVFRSPSAALVDMGDERYHWLGFRHATALPFALARGTVATGEIPIRDVRFVLALPLALAVLARSAWQRRQGALATPSAWLLAGTFSWMLLCPVQRYAVSLEILAGVLVVLAASRLAAASWRTPTLACMATLLAATTLPADFFHRPWSRPFAARVPDAVPPDATYGFLVFPLGYWTVASPRPAHAFSLMSTLMESGGRLQRRLDAILDRSGDRLWLVNLDTPVDTMVRAEMGIHGIALTPPCLRTSSPVWIDTVFCGGARVGPRADGASDLLASKPVDFSRSGAGLIYEISGWMPAEADGTWASGRIARLAFRPDLSSGEHGPMMLTLTLAIPLNVPPRRIKAQAAGGPTLDRELSSGQPGRLSLCVGPDRLKGGVATVHLDTDDVRSPRELGLGADPRPLAFKLFDMVLQPAHAELCSS